jgi:hypothetical protein
MTQLPLNTQLYQIYTRVYLNQLAGQLGRRATLDDIPDDFLHRLASQGFNWIYLLGVWETGLATRQIALANEPLRNELKAIYPELTDQDIVSSCFAITAYQVHPDFGGNPALIRLRERMAEFGLQLMLDFIPNHVAVDHPWGREHPEYIVMGDPELLEQSPDTYFRAVTAQGEMILAHGRDPYFPAWNDTLQLDYSNPALIEAMTQELFRVSGLCDGVRCDMAMLVLPEIFQRTWGCQAQPFWSQAIQRIRAARSGFIFLAEVYWYMEAELIEQGFDFTYDKRYYDHLARQERSEMRAHLQMDPAMLSRMAHFLENHDEKRAVLEFPSLDILRAAAVLTYLVPGLRFFQHGQLEGYRIRIPMQLAHPLPEQVDPAVKSLYAQLLGYLNLEAVRAGAWQMLPAEPGWIEGGYCDPVFTFAWEAGEGPLLWGVVNYSAEPALCTLRPNSPRLVGRKWLLVDRMSNRMIDCDGSDLINNGLPVKLAAWEVQIFEVEEKPEYEKAPA